MFLQDMIHAVIVLTLSLPKKPHKYTAVSSCLYDLFESCLTGEPEMIIWKIFLCTETHEQLEFKWDIIIITCHPIAMYQKHFAMSVIMMSHGQGKGYSRYTRSCVSIHQQQQTPRRV